MKKLLALFFLLLSHPAFAGVSCTLPFTLLNGTLADATQVMANYNAVVTCLANAAQAGANSDITSLGGLTTPISPLQGGSTTFIGTNTSTGSANAQVVSSTLPSNFSLASNFKVVFKAGFTNDTSATMTLQVGSTPATAVYRRTTNGIQPTVGGEVILGTIVEVVYDGTVWQLMSNVSPFPVGTVLETVGATADAGFLLLNNACVSTTTFAILWARMGSPGTGGCAAGQFALPDGRGRVIAQLDSGGSGRITVAGGNFDGTTLFNSGGLQNTTIGTANLPAYSPAGSVALSLSLNDAGHTHNYQGLTSAVVGTSGGGGAITAVTGYSGVNSVGSGTGFAVPQNNGSSASFTGTAQGGSSTPMSRLPPMLMLNRQIKY